MKYKLNLPERLHFLQLLPKENNFATLRIVRTVSKEVGVTDDEFKEFDIVRKDDQFNFNPEKAAIEKEFEIGEIAEQLIKSALEKLDQDKKLTQEYFSLYEKFVKSE